MSDYVFSFEDLEDSIFSNNPKLETEKTDIPTIKQYDANLCWFSSLASFFLYKYYKSNKNTKIEISISYILFGLYMEKIKHLFEIIDSYKDNESIIFSFINNGIDETGNWSDFKTIINKYGIVRKCDMKETKFSKNPQQINLFLTRFARIQLLKYNKTKSTKIKEETISKVYKFLVKCLGIPPKLIKVKGKNVSPQKYAKDIFLDIDQYEQILSIQSNVFNYNICYTNKFGSQIYNISFEDLKKYIKLQMKDEHLVVLGIDCRYGVDYKNQIFTYNPKAYEEKFGFNIMPERNIGHDTTALRINHNTLLFDERTINNKKYKICHDNFFADKICYMEEDWFNNYVFEAIINKKYLNLLKFTNKTLLAINSNF